MLDHKYSFEALGTAWVIETVEQLTLSLKKTIQDRIEVFDKTYSRFRSDSLITRIAEKEGTYDFPADASKLFDFYHNLYQQTRGRVTPLIGTMIARAGYDATYSLKAQKQEPIVDWDTVMSLKGTHLTTTQPILLDIGAAGKGYLVDIIAAILEDGGLYEYVIDASGDIKHKGNSENRVGLEHPLNVSKVIGVVSVKNKSLCASASNKRAWGDGMHHIFNPYEMAPVRDIIATWVIADEAMVADGIATALFFEDTGSLKDMYDYQYVRMYADGTVEHSRNFEGELF